MPVRVKLPCGPACIQSSGSAGTTRWERSGDPQLSHLDQPGFFTHRGVALATKVEGIALLAEMLTRKA